MTAACEIASSSHQKGFLAMTAACEIASSSHQKGFLAMTVAIRRQLQAL
jgi:hypothetical protein